MDSRATGRAIETYREIVKLENKLSEADARLSTLLGGEDVDMATYVDATTEIDRAVEHYEDRLRGGRYAESTRRSYFSAAIQVGRR